MRYRPLQNVGNALKAVVKTIALTWPIVTRFFSPPDSPLLSTVPMTLLLTLPMPISCMIASAAAALSAGDAPLRRLAAISSVSLHPRLQAQSVCSVYEQQQCSATRVTSTHTPASSKRCEHVGF
jgi:hypothetical protein